MAANAGTPVIGKRRHHRRKVMSEINVTPMVDVMLVLLIIFMVSAPLLTVGVPIDLPQSQAKSLDQDKEPLTISVNEKGQVYLQNAEIRGGRSDPQTAGDRAGARRDRSQYLRARRQKGGLRYHDEGHGAAVGRRLPQGRLGDRIRAGLESNADEDGIGDFGRAARRRCCCGRRCPLPARARGAAGRSAAGRSHQRQAVLRNDQGHEGRAQAAGEAQAGGREESRGGQADRGAQAQGEREERDRADRRRKRRRRSRSRSPIRSPRSSSRARPEAGEGGADAAAAAKSRRGRSPSSTPTRSPR